VETANWHAVVQSLGTLCDQEATKNCQEYDGERLVYSFLRSTAIPFFIQQHLPKTRKKPFRFCQQHAKQTKEVDTTYQLNITIVPVDCCNILRHTIAHSSFKVADIASSCHSKSQTDILEGLLQGKQNCASISCSCNAVNQFL
jgi:hypothetical protein